MRAFTVPSLDRWRHLSEAAAPPRPGQVRATFLGVSTILLTDGWTAILTDGFFSRPSLPRVLAGRLGPDRARIGAALRRFGIDRLDAVFVVHSHYDHALDSAVVAELTGARLIGSASTRNIARGQGFPDDRFDEAVTSNPFGIGAFRLTALPATHSPGDVAPGTVDAPLRPPARARAYRTGGCYSLHVRHAGRELLIHASANTRTGALDGYGAGTVYLGVGTLGKQDEAFRERYWDTLVRKTGARRVVPVHWDNFTVPLTRPLRPLPAFADRFDVTMEFLTRRAAADGVTLALPVLGQPTDPFGALADGTQSPVGLDGLELVPAGIPLDGFRVPGFQQFQQLRVLGERRPRALGQVGEHRGADPVQPPVGRVEQFQQVVVGAAGGDRRVQPAVEPAELQRVTGGGLHLGGDRP